MGNYAHLHVGTYMVVTANKEIDVLKKVHTCSDSECDRNKRNKEMTNKFCSICGALTANKDYVVKEFINPYHIICDEREFVNELCEVSNNDEKRQIFVSNHHAPFDDKKKLNDYDFYDVNLMERNHLEEIEWFKKRFEKIILFLEEKLGKEAIEFKWGIVQSYS